MAHKEQPGFEIPGGGEPDEEETEEKQPEDPGLLRRVAAPLQEMADDQWDGEHRRPGDPEAETERVERERESQGGMRTERDRL